MKRTYLFFIPLFTILSSVLFGSCKPKLKSTRALVKSVVINDDTLKYMTVQTGEEGDTAVYNLKQARLNNGMMMPQDSVIIEYIEGKNDTARALVVTILPKKVKEIVPSTQKGQVLRTITREELKKALNKEEKESEEIEKSN